MNPTEWPPLPYAEWENTRDTLHMWTQIVGKTRMALAPLENHLVERPSVRHAARTQHVGHSVRAGYVRNGV